MTHHVNLMTTCCFPPPRTSRLQATLIGTRCDCLASNARFTKRASPGPALDLGGQENDGVGHQDDELLRLHPVDAAHRQPHADPEVLEEHLENADDDDLVVLQCTARQERQQRGTVIIGNPVHRAFEQKTTHHGEFSLAHHWMVRCVFRLKKPNFKEQFARQYRYEPPPEFSLTDKVQHHSSPYTALTENSQDHGGLQG